MNPVATIHTHGEYISDYGDYNDIFSTDDNEGAEFLNITIYMVNPKGELLKYNPSDNKTSVIANDLPYDPKDPKAPKYKYPKQTIKIPGHNIA